MLSKNVNNKKCAPKFVFFNEKKSESFGWFLALKIDFESHISALLTPPYYNNLQNSMISFDYTWILAPKPS